MCSSVMSVLVQQLRFLLGYCPSAKTPLPLAQRRIGRLQTVLALESLGREGRI